MLQEIAEERGNGVITDHHGKSYTVAEAIRRGQEFNRYMASHGYHFSTGDYLVDWDGDTATITRLSKSGRADFEVARVDY
jgi:hypothetical protein